MIYFPPPLSLKWPPSPLSAHVNIKCFTPGQWRDPRRLWLTTHGASLLRISDISPTLLRDDFWIVVLSRQIYYFRWGLQVLWEHQVWPQTTVVSLNELLPLHQAHCFHFWRRNLSFLEPRQTSPSSHILIALINGEGIEGFFNQWEDLGDPLTVFRLPSMRAINSISWVAGNPQDLTRLTRVLCVSAQYPLYTNYRSCCGVVGSQLQYLAVEMPPDYWFSLENCI